MVSSAGPGRRRPIAVAGEDGGHRLQAGQHAGVRTGVGIGNRRDPAGTTAQHVPKQPNAREIVPAPMGENGIAGEDAAVRAHGGESVHETKCMRGLPYR